METADKTLIKQEAALLNERGGGDLRSVRNVSSRGGSPKQNNNSLNISGMSSVRRVSPIRNNHHHRGKTHDNSKQMVTMMLFRQDDEEDSLG